ALEVIVGTAARKRYANLQLDGEIALGRSSDRDFRVVGIFEANGGALESEVWAPRTVLASTYDRFIVSSVTLRLADVASAQAAIDYLEGPSVRLEAKPETEYYEELSRQAHDIAYLTIVMIGIMAVGAVFAVANTMYAAVDGRRREIAMLRTIGFSRRSIVTAFLLESLTLCLLGCAAGLGLSLLLNGMRQDYLSDVTWTVLAFELRITPSILALGLIVSLVVGVAGAAAPAVRAARTQIIEALRKA
ncbi:MAG: FtsX-like permease family protein, partial [Phycisphaerae bacterium]